MQTMCRAGSRYGMGLNLLASVLRKEAAKPIITKELPMRSQIKTAQVSLGRRPELRRRDARAVAPIVSSGLEETLVTDLRGVMRPAEMVEKKLQHILRETAVGNSNPQDVNSDAA